MMTFSGSVFGFMFGTVFKNDITAQKALELSTIMLNFGGGLLANVASGANWFVRFLGLISPIKYGA